VPDEDPQTAAVRIRLLDDSELELCNIEGCVTIYHQTASKSDDSSEPPWIVAPLVEGTEWVEHAVVPGVGHLWPIQGYAQNQSGLALVATAEAGDLIEPSANKPTEGDDGPKGEGEVGDPDIWVESTMAHEPLGFWMHSQVLPAVAADIASRVLLRDTVHVVARGSRIDLAAIAPIRATLGEGAEVAITVIEAQ